MSPAIDADSHWTFSWDLAPDKGPPLVPSVFAVADAGGGGKAIEAT
jgi:hypothetical protein